MSSNPRIFDDPSKIRGHMAAEISNALLCEAKVCPSCFAEWTPGVKDLLNYRYWPSTSSCQTLSRFDIFEAFAHMKASAPSMSRHAFLKLLEHPSVQAGRPGNICADTFQRSFFEYCFCKHTEEVMCDVNSFYCPACHPDKHYRFRKSRGTEEPSLYAGLFLAQDEEVSAFLNNIRGSSMTRANDSGMCGVSRFKASEETSKKSSSKLDEEGIQVAVCRKERTPVVEVQPDDDLQPVHLDQPSGRAARDRIVEHHF
ncbi:hypothetical protein Q8A67_012353 [Cirrhinus molitorella]|uniref:CxC3 like cysteine cluster domain-containing protein n=1 Tax=Cirrhinus molitorella TaxID=172907 RepID=A0AA88TJS0_9TELE|nr:hypothetical protein Q8A67_012353 [Cirrhinus molitorella]